MPTKSFQIAFSVNSSCAWAILQCYRVLWDFFCIQTWPDDVQVCNRISIFNTHQMSWNLNIMNTEDFFFNSKYKCFSAYSKSRVSNFFFLNVWIRCRWVTVSQIWNDFALKLFQHRIQNTHKKITHGLLHNFLEKKNHTHYSLSKLPTLPHLIPGRAQLVFTYWASRGP